MEQEIGYKNFLKLSCTHGQTLANAHLMGVLLDWPAVMILHVDTLVIYLHSEKLCTLYTTINHSIEFLKEYLLPALKKCYRDTILQTKI